MATMDEIKLYLDLDMNIKLRKALAAIHVFIQAKTEKEGIQEIEKAITNLNDVHKGLMDRQKMRSGVDP